MKKFFLFSILLLGLSAVSCKSDDTSAPNSPAVSDTEWEPKNIQITNTLIPVPVIDYPHSEGCSKDYLKFKSNDAAVFYHYEEGTCSVTEYEDAFQRTGNNVTVNVMGYTITGVIISETTTSMEIQSEISEYVSLIKVMMSEYEQYLSMLEGAKVKLLLNKK